ncbi:hypothetical protein BJY52DRAFT_101810 [Lactarius psammicola]|nr:hypothetical protein BJY52DRAFT_101810 [Lactarius psammicola]
MSFYTANTSPPYSPALQTLQLINSHTGHSRHTDSVGPSGSRFPQPKRVSTSRHEGLIRATPFSTNSSPLSYYTANVSTSFIGTPKNNNTYYGVFKDIVPFLHDLDKHIQESQRCLVSTPHTSDASHVACDFRIHVSPKVRPHSSFFPLLQINIGVPALCMGPDLLASWRLIHLTILPPPSEPAHPNSLRCPSSQPESPPQGMPGSLRLIMLTLLRLRMRGSLMSSFSDSERWQCQFVSPADVRLCSALRRKVVGPSVCKWE